MSIRGIPSAADSTSTDAQRRSLIDLLAQTPAIVNFLRGPDLVVDFAHPKTVEALGGRALQGKPLLEAIPEFRGQPYVDRLLEVYRTGQPYSATGAPVRIDRGNGFEDTYWDSVYLATRDTSGDIDGVMTFDVDVTDRVRAVEALDRDRHRQWRMQLLVEASVALSESLDYEETLRRIARLAVPAVADWCTIAVMDETGALRRLAVVHKDDSLRDAALEYERHHPPASHREDTVFSVVNSGKTVLREQITDDQLKATAQDEEHLRLLRALGCSSCIMAPMVVRGAVVGVISFMLSTPARHFDAEDVTLTEELARRAAVTIDNARLYRQAIRKEEGKRKQVEARLDLLIDSIKDYAVFMLDPSGHIVTWNTGAQRIKGYAAHEIIGRHFSAFYPESDIAAGKCEMELEVATRTGRFEDLSWRLRKDGTRFWANVIISPIKDENGVLVGFSKVTRDLTDKKRAEEDQAARAAAEQANRTKDEFLAMLGHELRNPLAPILTALQLMKLRGDGSSPKEKEIIERQVNHMVRLVDDLLDVSRITKGKIEIKQRALDLRDVIAKAVELASPLLETRRHHLAVEAPPHQITVHGDEARLSQVFANLIANAAKYTEPGGHITIAVLLPSDSEVVVEVRDDGVGIPPDLLPRIFELFVQGYQSAERSIGGLGIGLALARSLVELHGGTVGVKSAGVGAGSTFTVKLPRTVCDSAEPLQPSGQRAQPASSTEAGRVLVVDDNEDSADLISALLTAMGYEVRTALDGLSALEQLRTFPAEVAVLDIGLPVLDGYELATRIRQQWGAGSPYLIALTGYGQPADRARTLEAGFHAHLVKPVDSEKLLDAIRTGTTAKRYAAGPAVH